MGGVGEPAGQADHLVHPQMAQSPCEDRDGTELEVANGETVLLDSRMLAFRETLEGGTANSTPQVRPPDAETLHRDGIRSGTSQNSHTPARVAPYRQQ